MNTMQQEFDAVVAHLYKQGRPAKGDPSVGEGKACKYRAGELSCAVGCRIPDDVYSPQMDDCTFMPHGTGIHSLLGRFGDILPLEIVTYRRMFEKLQLVHDSSKQNEDGTFFEPSLESGLQEAASMFGLIFTKEVA